jgi:hypothetical protein
MQMYFISISSHTPESIPLVLITALSRVGYVCVSFALLDLWIFAHSSLKIFSSSVKLNLSKDFQWDLSLGFGWVTQGHSHDCSEAIPACFGCMLGIIVLSERKSSPPSLRLFAGSDQGFACICFHSLFPLSL